MFADALPVGIDAVIGKAIRRSALTYFASRALDPAHQQENEQNDDDEAQSAAAIVTGPIERTSTNPTEPAKQRNDQNNEYDRADAHLPLLLVMPE
jgi:hypothetical protein